jgi:glycosyltransferase involved in cell wall biosynthesis
MDNSAYELVAVMRMGHANTYYHLKPVVMSRHVSHLHIVRPLPPLLPGEIENSTYHEVKAGNIVTRLAKVFMKSLLLGMRPEVRGFVSFYSFPYGLIACLAGMLTGKPVHIGFVGDDWYGHSYARYGGILNLVFRRAAMTTVTGPKMRDEMIGKGFDPGRIVHLPHAIDLERYVDTPPEERSYDCIYVGDLIERKQVGVIISAIHEAKKTLPGIRLMIVGDGPLRPVLEARASSLGLDGNVTFAGFQRDTSRFFSDARMVIIASNREGFPFTLVEGMAAGAVPISTPVGTIPDIIVHGRTGLLFEVADAAGLAGCIVRLASDRELYGAIRGEVMKQRDGYSFGHVAGLWTAWLEKYFIRQPTDP